jgi:hypothetical protein
MRKNVRGERTRNSACWLPAGSCEVYKIVVEVYTVDVLFSNKIISASFYFINTAAIAVGGK